MPPGPAACSKVSEGMISEETFSMAAGPDVVVRFTAIISTRGNRLLGLQGHFRSGRPGCESACVCSRPITREIDIGRLSVRIFDKFAVFTFGGSSRRSTGAKKQ